MYLFDFHDSGIRISRRFFERPDAMESQYRRERVRIFRILTYKFR